MGKFTDLTAIATPLVLDNIDTEKILPVENLKTESRAGLGRALFSHLVYHEVRRNTLGIILPRTLWR